MKEYHAKPTMSHRYKVPSTNALVSRILLELLALCVLGYPMLHIYVILQGDAEPYKRGFFCDDETLKHPILPEEISVENCVLIWICIVLFFVPLVELLHFGAYKFKDWEEQIKQQKPGERWSCLSKIPLVVVELYRMLGYYFIGALGTLLTTEMAKYKIGRLRPYFLTACRIPLDPTLCLDSFGYNKFVTDYECITNGEEESKIVREARKSFLSGHSSFSFYSSTFLVIYLQARLSRRQHRHCQKRDDSRVCVLRTCVVILRWLKVWRPFLQFGYFALSLYIAFTRISDYKHHPTDIIAGIIVGVVFALIILLFLVDLFQRPRSFEEKIDDYDLLELQMANLSNGNILSPGGSPTANRDQDSHGASISELDMARDVALAPLAKIEDLPRLGDLPCLPTPPKGFRKNHKKS